MWKEAAVVSPEKLRKHTKIPEFEPRISQIPLGDKLRFPNSTRSTPKHLCQSNCKSHQSWFATLDKIKDMPELLCYDYPLYNGTQTSLKIAVGCNTNHDILSRISGNN